MKQEHDAEMKKMEDMMKNNAANADKKVEAAKKDAEKAE